MAAGQPDRPVPNPPPVLHRSVAIYAADLNNGRVRLVEPHVGAERWLEIDGQHCYGLEYME